GPARGSGPGSEGDPSADGLRFDYSPYDEVTDFLEAHRNWFPALEERAQALRQDARLGMRVSSEQLAAALEDQLGIRIRFVEEAGSVVRRWDPETQQLSLSSGILEQRAKFQIGVAAALRLFEVEQLHAPIVASDPPRHAETPRLLEIHLANYFAGALLLPYPAFFEQVQRRRYDVGRLAQIFESSYETVAHRLCNLSDPAQRGVPMHFLRVDLAGNISKRYSGDGIHFPHQHGSCPRMAVHLAFLSAHGIHRQYSRFPDGASYFCFAKVVGEPTRGSTARGTIYSIGIGARAEDAAHLAYADELPALSAQSAEAIAIPVGTTCRFCERSGCEMRSAPSYKHAFKVDAHVKKENFFSPLLRTDGEEGRPRARRRRER
ncbi:MAG: short-chain fatty acyl-CoA regulator family protein, partial [Myxococcales bacterium]|nr:short-chain fatty acyl-CoA regulator family protein [Myxococcales bacterium]